MAEPNNVSVFSAFSSVAGSKARQLHLLVAIHVEELHKLPSWDIAMWPKCSWIQITLLEVYERVPSGTSGDVSSSTAGYTLKYSSEIGIYIPPTSNCEPIFMSLPSLGIGREMDAAWSSIPKTGPRLSGDVPMTVATHRRPVANCPMKSLCQPLQFLPTVTHWSYDRC